MRKNAGCCGANLCLLVMIFIGIIVLIMAACGVFDNTDPRRMILDYSRLDYVNQKSANQNCGTPNVLRTNVPSCNHLKTYVQTFRERENIAHQLLNQDNTLFNLVSQSVTKNLDCAGNNSLRTECQAIGLRLNEDNENLARSGGLSVDEVQQYYISTTNQQQAIKLINSESSGKSPRLVMKSQSVTSNKTFEGFQCNSGDTKYCELFVAKSESGLK